MPGSFANSDHPIARVPWFPSLPEGWRQGRLDSVASVRARIGWKALTADEYLPEGFVFLSTPNIKSHTIDFENVNYISTLRYEESPELQLHEGDVLLAKDGNTLGITNIVRFLPRPATVNGSIAVVRPRNIDSRFLCYFLSSQVTQALIQALKGGMGVPHLFQADLNRFPVAMPPRELQVAIADFLDRETARLDEMVGKKQHLIRLITERLAGVISTMAQGFATRAGDSPLRPMALSSEPRGWKMVRLKYLLRRLEQGWSPQCENRPAEPGEWGVLKVGCVKDGTFYADENKALPTDVEAVAHLEVRPGDILMSRANTRELLGSVALVPDVRSGLLVCDKLYRLTPDDSLIHRRFFVHALRTASVREQLEAEATGASSSMQNIGQDSVRELLIAIPEVEEQRRIGEAIEEQSRRAQAALRRVEAAVDRLKEYRLALITAAVTGQMDVSGAVA